MSKNQDRAAVWERTAGIEAMLGPRGGLAVWMRRDELQSYAAARGATKDFVATVSELAVLQKGIDSLIESMAKMHDMPAEELRRAIQLAMPAIEDRMHHVGRITPVKDNHEQST